MYTFPGAKPKRGRIEIRLEDGLHDVLQGRLDDPVFHRRDAQGAKLPWFPGLGNQLSLRWTRSERAAAQLASKPLDS